MCQYSPVDAKFYSSGGFTTLYNHLNCMFTFLSFFSPRNRQQSS